LLIRGVKIQDRIARFNKMGIEALLKDAQASSEFATLYLRLYNEKICVGCRGAIRQKFNELMNINPEKLKIMSSRKFVLNPNALIDRSMASKGPSGMYNASNITDQIAIELLRHHKGYISSFTEFPKDWQEIVAKTPAPKPEKAPEPVASTDPQGSVPNAETSPVEVKSSTDMNAKEVIAALDKIGSVDEVEMFTAGEQGLKNKRKTVLKAIKKRIRQLSE